MLRVNVGLSRKLSRDYNSSGFSVNLDGEIPVTLDDPTAILRKISEYFDLAEAALDEQVQTLSDGPNVQRTPSKRNGSLEGAGNADTSSLAATNRLTANGYSSEVPRATPKQKQFMNSLVSRIGISDDEVQSIATDLVGYEVNIASLSKREAGVLLDHLTGLANSNGTNRKSTKRSVPF